MEVAIMGAGMSGLSCALTLEKHGIKPRIFEKRSRVGDRFVNGEAMFSILNRPIKDSIEYISKEFDIHLKPITETNKIVIHSKNEVGSIEGKIGYLNIRGRHENSYESQLAKQVKTEINYNSIYSYEDLCKKYDYVVLATGDGEYACDLGNYRCDLTCKMKGVSVEGEFNRDVPEVWFNYEVVPKGYGWLIPYSEREANIVIAYPCTPNNIKLDLNQVFENFYSLICEDINQKPRITDEFQFTRYMMGICNSPKIDNTYFVGNCFGAISPGLGFGQFTAILTGVYSAYDICGIDKYEKLVRPLFDNYNNSLELRRYLQNLTDDKLDSSIKLLDNKFFDKLIDKIFSAESQIDLMEFATPVMKLNNYYKKKLNN
ncbi:NAD(P)/FAD-dependent oxidoreductase [Clostridium paridis]|uniref:NAD(P)/FAD-dependent oxidoreductase n=1 Tax=Clostridium paridis TaxID=2803863 RepID=A0A937K616_9CLOT|nr:NAD(P)/FAD-dependent oxidoreductase [Clostridium paridis]MBL4933060.1 NAD(P)/FAD-dependent oxidoreductase [Clostridium paridis]